MAEKETKPDQQLAVLPQSSIVPQSFKELNEFAGIIAKTDMIPNGYKNKPGDCLVAMMMGHELGLPYLMALQNIATINGKPSIYGDLGLALVRSSRQLEEFDEFDQGQALKEQTGKCVLRRAGDKKERVFTFSVEDAKRAGLWGKQGPWTNYPGRMLQMRARAFALRDVFPDVLKGLGIAEEAADFIDTTAERVNLSPAAVPPVNQKPAEAPTEQAKTEATATTKPAETEAPKGYLIDKVSKSAHPGLFYITINGVRYSCANEEVAKGAFELCEHNNKSEKPKRIEFVSETKDGAQFLVSYNVVTVWPS